MEKFLQQSVEKIHVTVEDFLQEMQGFSAENSVSGSKDK